MAIQLRDLDIDLITRGHFEKGLESLREQFAGTFSPETIERYLIDEINPEVITAMAELGLDLSQEFPKPMTDEFVQAADVVITMGCGDACPIYPGKRYEDWDLEDPADADLEGVRSIRDEIARRVGRLAEELAPALAP